MEWYGKDRLTPNKVIPIYHLAEQILYEYNCVSNFVKASVCVSDAKPSQNVQNKNTLTTWWTPKPRWTPYWTMRQRHSRGRSSSFDGELTIICAHVTITSQTEVRRALWRSHRWPGLPKKDIVPKIDFFIYAKSCLLVMHCNKKCTASLHRGLPDRWLPYIKRITGLWLNDLQA